MYCSPCHAESWSHASPPTRMHASGCDAFDDNASVCHASGSTLIFRLPFPRPVFASCLRVLRSPPVFAVLLCLLLCLPPFCLLLCLLASVSASRLRLPSVPCDFLDLPARLVCLCADRASFVGQPITNFWETPVGSTDGNGGNTPFPDRTNHWLGQTPPKTCTDCPIKRKKAQRVIVSDLGNGEGSGSVRVVGVGVGGDRRFDLGVAVLGSGSGQWWKRNNRDIGWAATME